MFTILPYIEQEALYNLGLGLSGSQEQNAIAKMIQTPLAVQNCPTRRPLQTWPVQSWLNQPYGSAVIATAARGDYGANAGYVGGYYPYVISGPGDLPTGDQMAAAGTWPDISAYCQGIAYLRSAIKLANVTDGSSNTYLVGEKYLNPDSYANGTDGADNETMYAGFDNDNHRSSNNWPVAQDTPGYANADIFGSAHFGSLNMLFCDGSVKPISYSIDQTTHTRLGTRSDGLPVDQSKY